MTGAELALAIVALLPIIESGVDACRSITNAPKYLESFKRDLETYLATLNTIKAAYDEISSRPDDDKPELSSLASTYKTAVKDCEATAGDLKNLLGNLEGESLKKRWQFYLSKRKISGLQSALVCRGVTLSLLLQALEYAPGTDTEITS